MPQDSSEWYNLGFYSLENGSEEDGSLEASPDQSNTVSLLLNEKNMHAFKVFTCINSLLWSERNNKNVWRSLKNNRYSRQSLAFSCLVKLFECLRLFFYSSFKMSNFISVQQ